MTSLPPVAIVDDDSATLKALGRLLRAAGFEPLGYTSAEEFLASPPLGPVVCLVLDVRLGGMSGLDMQRRLKALGSTIPVVIMSGVDDPAVKAEAYQLGCFAYLSKDTNPEVLLGLIRSIVSSPAPSSPS